MLCDRCRPANALLGNARSGVVIALAVRRRDIGTAAQLMRPRVPDQTRKEKS
jgi:hypothetical protein